MYLKDVMEKYDDLGAVFINLFSLFTPNRGKVF